MAIYKQFVTAIANLMWFARVMGVDFHEALDDASEINDARVAKENELLENFARKDK